MRHGRSRLRRYISAFVVGVAILFPILNQNGVITAYEAIAAIWVIFLVPAYLTYLSLSDGGNRQTAMKFVAVLYVMGSVLYSLFEPIIAGVNIGFFEYLIPVPVSFIVMIPSFYLSYRSKSPRPGKILEPSDELTSRLRRLLENVDGNPPTIVFGSQGSRLPITHTDGPGAKIVVSSSLLSMVEGEELDAALLKAYYDMKEKKSLRLVYKINVSFMLYLDALIALPIMINSIAFSLLQEILLIALAAVVIGFMAFLPLLIREITLRNERGTDLKVIRLMGSASPLKSYILRDAEKREIFSVSAITNPSRINRIRKNRMTIARRRSEFLDRPFQ